MANKTPNVVLLLSDARGVYIPRDFVTDQYNDICEDTCKKWGISAEDANILANPESDFYWETWHHVLDNAKCILEDGRVFHLHQDGDLWALCYDEMTEEEKHNFCFDV